MQLAHRNLRCALSGTLSYIILLVDKDRCCNLIMASASLVFLASWQLIHGDVLEKTPSCEACKVSCLGSDTFIYPESDGRLHKDRVKLDDLNLEFS